MNQYSDGVADFVSLCDLAPTFLEIAGLKPSSEMTSRSLLPILTSKKSGQIDPTRTFVLTGMEQHVYSYPSRDYAPADDSNYREAKQRLQRKLDAELLNSNDPRLAAAGNRD